MDKEVVVPEQIVAGIAFIKAVEIKELSGLYLTIKTSNNPPGEFTNGGVLPYCTDVSLKTPEKIKLPLMSNDKLEDG